MIYILLPAYNEEEGLEYLLDRIKRITTGFSIEYKVVIVDDGSTDHTGMVIKSYSNNMPIDNIRFDKNMGITQVFKEGFKRVCGLAGDDDICVTMDSDNTQNPYVMLDMIKAMDGPQKPDIVIASRFAKGGGTVGAPLVREWLSMGVSHILRRLIAIKGLKDYSTFYRAYRMKVIKEGFGKYGEAFIEGHGFSAMARFLIRLSTITDRIQEVPFVLRYDLKEGGTGMNIPRTIWGYLDIMRRYLRNGKDL